jgi:hypothetical protein
MVGMLALLHQQIVAICTICRLSLQIGKMEDIVSVKRFSFTVVKEIVQYILNAEEISDAEFEARIEQATHNLILALYRKRICQQETASKDVFYPATWWNHFKLQCFPKWLLRKFPCKMKAQTVTVLAKIFYDKIRIPEYVSEVVLEVQDG